MVIQFNTRVNELYNNKLHRFNQLKIGYFEQNLSEIEEIELNQLESWLKVHNN
jgi:hypothetical protein